VLDGEILIWQPGAAPAPFADLQNAWAARRSRARLLAELPAVLVAYDLLELDGATCATCRSTSGARCWKFGRPWEARAAPVAADRRGQLGALPPSRNRVRAAWKA
jgi:hypothetical protein